MIKSRIKKLRNCFENFGIDGYVVPKNDEFFSEYSKIDRLKLISNFSGSAGFAIILKKRNYLFVDGRYTIQAHLESGKNFQVKDYSKIFDCSLFKDLTLGIDPKLFTSDQLKKKFSKYNHFKKIELNLIDQFSKNNFKNNKPFFSLTKNIVGVDYKKKLKKVINYLNKNKLDYIFITAPENVAWLMNIRGYDIPTSPIPNCHLILTKKKDIFLITEKKKAIKIIKEKKFNEKQIVEPNKLKKILDTFEKGKILIDQKTCSLFYENLLSNRFKIIKKEDPIYLFKSIKNKTEIKNMIKSHIIDGVALTKFLYWIKKINKKKITEFDAQNKLDKFRKLNKEYLFPSFNTIAGSGKNGAIIHYRASKKKF